MNDAIAEQSRSDGLQLRPRVHMLFVQYTNLCNIECKHCFVSSGPRGEFGLAAEKVVSLGEEAHDLFGRITMVLSGGEPLARKKETLGIIEQCSQWHEILLLTNGMLIDDRVANVIKNTGTYVRISLDGASPEVHDYIRGQGSFDKALKGIQILIDAGVPRERIELFTTIVPETASKIDDVLDLAKKLGLIRLKFEPVAKTGRALEFWPNIAVDIPDADTEEYRCYFDSEFQKRDDETWDMADIDDTSFGVLTIYPDGSVYPYTFTDERDKKVGYLGNVKSSSLSDIYDSEALTNAIIGKFLMLSRGPARSLRALRIFRSESSPMRPSQVIPTLEVK